MKLSHLRGRPEAHNPTVQARGSRDSQFWLIRIDEKRRISNYALVSIFYYLETEGSS